MKDKGTLIPINQEEIQSYLKDIRKAELHEIDITNLSNDEILEIAKQYFPKGTKYIPTSRVSKDTDTSTGEFIWGYDKRLEDARLFTGIYEDGKCRQKAT